MLIEVEGESKERKITGARKSWRGGRGSRSSPGTALGHAACVWAPAPSCLKECWRFTSPQACSLAQLSCWRKGASIVTRTQRAGQSCGHHQQRHERGNIGLLHEVPRHPVGP